MGLVRSLLTAPLAPVAGVAWLAETIERAAADELARREREEGDELVDGRARRGGS